MTFTLVNQPYSATTEASLELPPFFGAKGDVSPFQTRVLPQLTGCMTMLRNNLVALTGFASLGHGIDNLGFVQIHHRVFRNIAIVFEPGMVQSFPQVRIAAIQVIHRHRIKGNTPGLQALNDLPFGFWFGSCVIPLFMPHFRPFGDLT